jgi:hypothetical protein
VRDPDIHMLQVSIGPGSICHTVTSEWVGIDHTYMLDAKMFACMFLHTCCLLALLLRPHLLLLQHRSWFHAPIHLLLQAYK